MDLDFVRTSFRKSPRDGEGVGERESLSLSEGGYHAVGMYDNIIAIKYASTFNRNLSVKKCTLLRS